MDQTIEGRIRDEVVVDAYDEIERSVGWYYYLDDTMAMPFKAECVQLVSSSPLEVGETVTVIGMDELENCEHDMLVKIKWKTKKFCVPLRQLKGVGVDDDTERALGDWVYWVSQGYRF